MKMQLIRQFSDLWNHFQGTTNVETNVSELSSIWECTRRNVNLVLSQLQTARCIAWVPANGRGKLSQLSFLRSAKEIKLQKAMEFANKGQLESAFTVVDSLEEKQSFLDMLENNLGFKNVDGELELLRIPFYRPILFLDPLHTTRRTEAHLVDQIFDNLVRYDLETQKVVPHLAHAWSINKNGKQWIFYLRKNIYFHHNRKMTADDVKHTLLRLKNKKSAFQQMFRCIRSIQCDSDFQVTVDLHHEHNLFLDLLTSTQSVIQPHDKWDHPDYAKLPVGTGPFKVSKNNEHNLVLEAFPRYFQERALLDRIEIWVFENREVVLKENSDVSTFRLHVPAESHATQSALEKGYFMLMCNLGKSKHLQNIGVRRYLKGIMDPCKMLDDLGGKRDRVAYTILPEWGEFPLQEINPQEWPSSKTLKIYAYEASVNEENVSWVQKELESHGIPVELTVLPYQEFSNFQNVKDADLLCYGEVMMDNLVVSIFETFACNISYLRHCLDDSLLAELDQRLEAFLAISEPGEQFQALRELNQFVINEYVVLPLYHTRQHLTARKDVQGIHLGNSGWMPFKNLWIQR